MMFIPFEPIHLLIVSDVNTIVETENGGIDTLKLGEILKSKGPCLTLMNPDPIACGGLGMLFSHSAEAWLRLSQGARGPHVAREIRKQVNTWINDLQLVRLQATGPVEWKDLCRWWEWLGMQYEGTLRQYGPNGDDYFMYAWVRRWHQ